MSSPTLTLKGTAEELQGPSAKKVSRRFNALDKRLPMTKLCRRHLWEKKIDSRPFL